MENKFTKGHIEPMECSFAQDRSENTTGRGIVS